MADWVTRQLGGTPLQGVDEFLWITVRGHAGCLCLAPLLQMQALIGVVCLTCGRRPPLVLAIH